MELKMDNETIIKFRNRIRIRRRKTKIHDTIINPISYIVKKILRIKRLYRNI